MDTRYKANEDIILLLFGSSTHNIIYLLDLLPAQDYSHADVAKNSTKYCRRKKFWDVVSLWL